MSLCFREQVTKVNDLKSMEKVFNLLFFLKKTGSSQSFQSLLTYQRAKMSEVIDRSPTNAEIAELRKG